MLNIQRVLTLTSLLLIFNSYKTVATRNLSFTPIVIEGAYEKQYELVINTTVEYVFLYRTNNVTWMQTARINVESNATHNLPLIVVVRGKKETLSWQIPLVVNSMYFNELTYNKTSRTLCSTKDYQNAQGDTEEFVTISLSTASYNNISFKLNVTEDFHFYLRLGENRSIAISPSEPIFFGYTFPEHAESSSVIVHVTSESDVCMTVSVQNTSCPVFDLERNIEFTGVWQTVNRQGGITVPREAYPLGFFVVLVVKGDDTDCFGSPNMISLRNKNVMLKIIDGITKQDYLIASMVAISIIFSFCIIYVVGVVVLKIKEGRKISRELYSSQETENIDEPMPSPSTIEEIGPHQSVIEEDSSLEEDDIDLLEDALSDKEVIRTKLVLSVCDLARKDPKILRHKSKLYLYYLGTVAIFYTLPAVQLVITYQKVLQVTGNQDMCYYNFLCAHPFQQLSDFNHVFSNFGYVILGLLFIFLTHSREHNELEKEKNKCYGIPQHYGLFYAMGTALIMEGILSGSYHVCPNSSNFQFDTSFMYIIAVLCMIKIYQTRHPDINARAPITFGILALIIFIGLMGVLNGSIFFWVTFTIAHLSICLFLTIQIYYMGRWRWYGFRGIITRMIQNCRYDLRIGIGHLFRPLYLGRFIMLVVANLCNVGLAVFGNITHEKNFATFLLAILMSNLILYTLFYIVMKKCHKERILLQPLMYIILSIIFWAAAMYFFINKTISWALTPAQSRLYNKPCMFLSFFDSHDIWHFLSAFAMFFSFMVLLTLDDDLVDVHRSQIPVF
ncbi:SID1 transmembrane family member 1 isoform X2 [Nomia melanderi]|uniref:SID1 transmembrane family member 1 isoform X2 n=1 Tax=Nomia melanderi TaxID=2448451 RepID=UPI00130428F3|nr:SID1 transmembrane family member 1-like isoform X2 [Nomia melanderi]